MVISEETDQVFSGVSGDMVIEDGGNNRKLTVRNVDGWCDTVVWNPYGNEGEAKKTSKTSKKEYRINRNR